MLTRAATALFGINLLDKSKPGAESYYVPRAPQDTSLDEMSIQS